jgi:hypothetical protein
MNYYSYIDRSHKTQRCRRSESHGAISLVSPQKYEILCENGRGELCKAELSQRSKYMKLISYIVDVTSAEMLGAGQ